MDKNRSGTLVEGYGASNHRTHALSAPRWDESKFAVEASTPRTRTIARRGLETSATRYAAGP